MSSVKSSAVRDAASVRAPGALWTAHLPVAFISASGTRIASLLSIHSRAPPLPARLTASTSTRPSLCPPSSRSSTTTSSAGMVVGWVPSNIDSTSGVALAGMRSRASRAKTPPPADWDSCRYSTYPSSSRAWALARQVLPLRVAPSTTSCSVRPAARSSGTRSAIDVGRYTLLSTEVVDTWGDGSAAWPSTLCQASMSSAGSCTWAVTPVVGKMAGSVSPTVMAPRCTRADAPDTSRR